jgi:hypothetical protein
VPAVLTVPFINKLKTLHQTVHEGTACLAFAVLLGNGAHGQLLLSEFLSFPDRVAMAAIAPARAAFSFESLQAFSNGDLARLLAIAIESIKQPSKAELALSLELLLNIARAAPVDFIAQNGKAMLDAVGAIVGTVCPLSDIWVLNVVGEIAKRGQNAAWFVPVSPVSFGALLPLVVSADPKVHQRALGIFAVSIFGVAPRSAADPELIFASLMSLFCGIENSPAGYAAMALSFVKTLQKEEKVGREALGLLGAVARPLVAVGGCEQVVTSVFKFLAKRATADDSEVRVLAMTLMTQLAGSRHALVARRSD